MKSDTLEKKLGFFRIKEQKLDQQLSKFLSGTKNQTQLLMYKKTLESPTKASEEDEYRIASLKEKIALRANSSLAKNTQKRNYALVAILKLAQAQ